MVALLAGATSCSARPDADSGWEDEPGTVTGELVVRIADFADGRHETIYVLRKGTGKEQRLLFGDVPDLEPGARLKVWGNAGADGIVVDKYQPAPAGSGELGSASSELINPTPLAPRIFCAAVVSINNGNIPASLNVAATGAQFHTGAKSVNAYMIENSFGRYSITGKAYGPFNYNMSGCDYAGLRDAIKPMIADKCDHYGFLITPNQQSCQWEGIGDEGTATKPQTDTWYNASLSLGVTVQEPGHNIGLNHASSITCTGAPFTDNLSGCKHSEYGDQFDTMGNGVRHMSVWPKQYMGWFGGCNVIKVTSSGTFNLLPIESACDGVQGIQIPFPGGKTRPFAAGGNVTLTSYYLEYRAPLGFDSGMTPQVFIRVDPNPPANNTRSNPHSWILTASGNAKNPGLTAGGSFSDPAGGLTITVTALDSQKATIQVDYPGGAGDPSCMDGTILTPPGPTTCIGAVSADGGVLPPPDGGFAGAGGGGHDGGRDGGPGNGGRGGASGGPPDSGPISGSGGMAGATGSGGAGGGSISGVGGGGSPAGAGGSAMGGSGVGVGGLNPTRPPAKEDLQGGCSCRVDASESKSSRSAFATLATGLLLSFVRRRRGARRSIKLSG